MSRKQGNIRETPILCSTGKVADPLVPGSGPGSSSAYEDRTVHVYRVGRVLHCHRSTRTEEKLEPAYVAFGTIGDEDFIYRELASIKHLADPFPEGSEPLVAVT
jgi:hypothetical protein